MVSLSVWGSVRVGRSLFWSAALTVMGLMATPMTLTFGQAVQEGPVKANNSNIFESTIINSKLDKNSDTLEEGVYFNVHTLEVQVDKWITIDLTSRQFDPVLVLFDSEHNVIAKDDDGGIGRNARLIVALPKTGTYTILVISASPAARTGNYSLSWRETSTQDRELAEAEQLTQQMTQLYKEGQYAAAIPLAKRALAIQENVLGPRHLKIVASLNNLAALYDNQGQYTTAEPLYQRALDISEKALGPEHPSVAISLNNLAELYRTQSNYAEAEPLFQRALTIFEKALGPEHPNVAISLNNLAALYDDQGNYTTAEPFYQRALTIFEKALGPEHPSVATNLNNLALLYYAQGNYAKAQPLFQRALDISEKALGPEHPSVATILNSLAELHSAQGNYTKAEPLYQRSLAISEKTLGPEHPAVAASLNNLAELYQSQGNYAKAESFYHRALMLFEQTLGPEHPKVAISLNNLAGLYNSRSNYTKAESLYLRALAIQEKVLGSQHSDVAASLNNLATLYIDQGNYPEAEPLYKRTLAILEKNLGPEHPNVAASLNNLAVLYQSQGNYAEAQPLSQRALAIFEKVLGPRHPNTATHLNNLAFLYYAQGNYAEAEPLYQRALTLKEETLGPEHPEVATGLNNLAELYKAQGNYTKALPFYQRALIILEQELGAEHPNVAISLNNLATLYQSQENYAKVQPLLQRAITIKEKTLGVGHPRVATSIHNLALLFLAQENTALAIDFITRAISIEEQNLSLILATGSEARKRAYMATLSGATDVIVSIIFQEVPTSTQAARLALTTVLQRKGRILDVLTDSLQNLRQNLTPADQMLLDQLNTTRSQLATLIFKGVEDISAEQYRASVSTLKANANELENTLARRSAEFRVQSQPATITAVQQQIPKDAALVELVRYRPFNAKANQPDERWKPPHYAAYILHPQGELQWVNLGETEAIDQVITEFRDYLRDPKTPTDAQLKVSARNLDALVMEPVRKLLGNTRKILLSPDSQLNLIPFAALVDENNEYLLENYTIQYLSSGRDLLRFANSLPSKQSPILLADPNYNKPGNPQALPAQTTRSSDNQRSRDIKQFQVSPLKATGPEAQAIAKLLPNAQLLTKSNATENALKQLQAPEILHLATHGFFLDIEQVAPPDFAARSLPTRSSFPNFTLPTQETPLLRSGLALAGFNLRQSGTEDGVLTALEAAGLNLRGTQLVVLSACDTGVGDIANGEGVYGLRRAFAIAGAESQLLSLWKVDDIGTKDLMVSYYQKLIDGQGRSEAIRATQLEMLRSEDYQHPYYWASFIPSGDWTPLKRQPGQTGGPQ